MKQAIGIFAAIFMMPALSVQAWLGGPFTHNNNYGPTGDDGVYEAIGTMTNGTGLFRFAVQNNNGGGTPIAIPTGAGSQTSNVQFGGLIGAANPHTWYYKGMVYYGRCFGTVNSSMGIVSVVGNAANDGVDGTIAGNALNGTVLASGGAPTIAGTATATPQPSAFNSNSLNGLGNNKGYANSTFTADITDKFPNMRFHGRGSVSFVGLPDNSIETTFIQRTPRRADRNNDGFSDRQSTFVHQELFGDDPDFSQVGHKRTFIVFGNRVSFTVTS